MKRSRARASEAQADVSVRKQSRSTSKDASLYEPFVPQLPACAILWTFLLVAFAQSVHRQVLRSAWALVLEMLVQGCSLAL